MAIGPTGSNPLPPVPLGSGGPVVTSRDSRDLARTAEDGRRVADEADDILRAEPVDEDERRQFNLEQTADQVRQLNPNAPRGSILDIVV